VQFFKDLQRIEHIGALYTRRNWFYELSLRAHDVRYRAPSLHVATYPGSRSPAS